ncbi:hypothetical protein PC112_g16425 [Phytophthora cactorum]|nr:hypothetical protein PC112_g16425 [Phytophthora cactorum]
MSDLLNANENDASIRDRTQTQDGTINRNATDVPVAVGEPNVTPREEPAKGVPPSEEAPMGTELLTQAEQEEDLQGRTQEADPSPIDAFGLDYDGLPTASKRAKMSPHYLIRNAVLMRRAHLGARAGPARTICAPAVPLPFIETVLHYCHADIFSDHLGKTKTADKVRRHVVDAIGLLVVTLRGNKYILAFVDYFTRWVEAFAVASLDTISFVDAMIEGVICRHGVPERLLSDRASNITSNLARSLYETLGIKKLFGSAYHPQTQGRVERFNGTLLGMPRMVLFANRTAYHEGLGDTPFFSLYGRDPVLPIDLAFLNTGKDWKSNEVAMYRRKLYHSLRNSRRLVERQLIKAEDRYEKRLDKQVRATYAEGDAVWVYQFFRARLGERKTKKLAFSWHGPYLIVGQVGENAYMVTIPSHPNKIVTVNVNRLKRFRGRWSRPFADEIPEGAEENASEDGTGPLQEKDLPPTSFVERLSVGGEETAFLGVSSPIVDIVAKWIEARELQYLVLTATYETFWLSRAALAPEFGTLIRAFEDADRKQRGLPELRRNARLVEANADVDDAEVLF